MNNRIYTYQPDYAIPPGETISECMECSSMHEGLFANALGIGIDEFTSLLKGDVPLLPEIAQKLETLTPYPAEFWNTLEAQYQKQLQIEWIKNFPLTELFKRGMILEYSRPEDQLQSVYDFFGVKNIHEWNNRWMQLEVAARRSRCFETNPYLAATWLRIGEIEAQKHTCPPTDILLFQSKLDDLRSLTLYSPKEFLPKIRSICLECGILFLLIPELKGLPWNGATKWMGDTATIMLNIRGKGEDKFWFSLFHEAGHVILHDKNELLINDGSEEDQREKEANNFAADVLFGSNRQFITHLRSQRDIIDFASKLGISPGLVAGQYQFLTGRYNHFNRLITKYKWVN